MKQENKGLLIRYLISFGIASVLTVGVFAIQGFFTDSPAVNMQILADGFTISGLLLTLYAGMIFVSSQGALIGISYVFRNIVLTWFVPMGRAKHEQYGEYRERKLEELKKRNDLCVLFRIYRWRRVAFAARRDSCCRRAEESPRNVAQNRKNNVHFAPCRR